LLTILRYLIFILFSCILFSRGFSQCAVGNIPDPIIVDSVSVLPNGDVVISWQPSVFPDLVKYQVVILDPITSNIVIIDSVSAGTTTFTIPFNLTLAFNVNASDITSNDFAIRVRDNCNNLSLALPESFNNTIFLEHNIDICSSSAILRWNAYDDFQSGTNVMYEIFMSVNGGIYNSVGTTSSLTYNYAGLNKGDNYQFFVKAIENNGAGPFASSSNVIDVSGNFLIEPNFLYEYTATVIDSSHIQIYFYADTAADISEYIVKRALANSHVYTTIATITDFSGMNPLIQYDDYEVEANNFSYFYQIYSVNTCGDLQLISNEGRTIKLIIENNNVMAKNTLTWNWYEGWLGGVNKYEIYRSESGNFNFELVTSISSAGDEIMTFEDDVSNLTEGTGEFCYKIKAIENNVAHVGNLPFANSFSNEVCVKHTPLIYIPNAFNPSWTANTTFKPSAILFDFTSYSFMIYDRWGQKVFETTEYEEAWNGKFNNSGASLPTGTYIYVLKLLSSSGEELTKRGMVTIVQ
jgi:gliding motility-associated-like protein